MFGIHYTKFEPTDYVIVYENGKVKREGKGLSFYYFAPRTSIVKVPLSSVDVPFIFNEMSSDFQTLTIQGQVSYRIIDQNKISETLNFALNKTCDKYSSSDPEMLSNKVINVVRVVMKKVIEEFGFREAIISSDNITMKILDEIRVNTEILSLGIEIMGTSILSMLPNKETARALEAGAREEILKKADEAIYERRNASINQERMVQENEYNTEVALEFKKREVLEKELESTRFEQEKKNEIADEQMQFDTEFEQNRQNLIDLELANSRAEADANAYALSVVLKAVEDIDVKVLDTLSRINMEPAKLIAAAFGDLANNAEKIGSLNITPDLLQEVMKG